MPTGGTVRAGSVYEDVMPADRVPPPCTMLHGAPVNDPLQAPYYDPSLTAPSVQRAAGTQFEVPPTVVFAAQSMPISPARPPVATPPAFMTERREPSRPMDVTTLDAHARARKPQIPLSRARLCRRTHLCQRRRRTRSCPGRNSTRRFRRRRRRFVRRNNSHGNATSGSTEPAPMDTPTIPTDGPVEEPPKPNDPPPSIDEPPSDSDAPTKEPPTGPDDVEPRIDDPRVPGQPSRKEV